MATYAAANMLRNRVRSTSNDSLDVPGGAPDVDNGFGGHVYAKRPSHRRASWGNRRGGAEGPSSCAGGVLKLLLTVGLMAASGGGVFYYLRQQHEETETRLQSIVEAEKAAVKKLKDEVKQAIDEKKQAQQNLMDTNKDLVSQRSLVATKQADLEKTEKLHTGKIHELVDYKKKMHANIQNWSKQKLIDKFGPGPHRCEIKLSYDPKSNVANEQGGNTFVIEMAPEALMPHAVYTFLEQADRGLYNGCSFHRNANHVMQAGPVGNFKTPPNTHLYDRFKKSGFEKLLFNEYSKDFPHYKYTLGYAGRPGGPDWYISTM